LESVFNCFYIAVGMLSVTAEGAGFNNEKGKTLPFNHLPLK
jgi:hypothetical protein